MILVIFARSTSFVMTKIGLQEMETFSLLGFRFLTAFLLLLPFGWKRLSRISLKDLTKGMLLGASFFATMAAEVSGLQTTNASTASFLENTAIVFVPLFEAVLNRRAPGIPVLISTVLSLFGVGLLTLKDGSFQLSGGELLCLLSAVFYACSIILTDRISKQGDPLALGILQVGFMGAYSVAAALFLGSPRIPSTIQTWVMILTLAVVCSGFGFTLQPLAQRYTTAERAGLFCALGPVGATISARIFLNETIGFTGACGILLILTGMALIPLYDRFLERRAMAHEIQQNNSGIHP